MSNLNSLNSLNILNTTRIVTGAMDKEMETIISIAKELDIYVFSTGANPRTAYALDVIPMEGDVWVECGPKDGKEAILEARGMVIDHHQPNDPGFGMEAANFWKGSSLGQFCELIEASMLEALQHGLESEFCQLVSFRDDELGDYAEVVWDDAVYYAAAADHCPAQAYKGECPGIEPDRLMEYRAAWKAAFQKRDVAEVLADMVKAQETLLDAAKVVFQLDYNNYFGVVFLPETVNELPEAALRTGVGYLTHMVDRDGKKKIVLGGSNKAEHVEVIMKWMKLHLTGVYGVPARGFCGGYLPEDAEITSTSWSWITEEAKENSHAGKKVILDVENKFKRWGHEYVSISIRNFIPEGMEFGDVCHYCGFDNGKEGEYRVGWDCGNCGSN